MAATPGQIRISIGGGEYGRGFYTQFSERHALAWALRVKARLNGPPVVLRLDIDDVAYGRLVVFQLDTRLGLNLTEILERWNAKSTFVTSCCDLIEGPIRGDISRLQPKFESDAVQLLLNGNDVRRTVI